MKQRDTRRVRELRRDAGQAPLIDNLRDRVAILPTRAAPNPIMDVLMSAEAEQMAEARFLAKQRQLAVPDEEERRRRKMEADLVRWERSVSRGG